MFCLTFLTYIFTRVRQRIKSNQFEVIKWGFRTIERLILENKGLSTLKKGHIEKGLDSSHSSQGKFLSVILIFISDGVELERFTASKDDFIRQKINNHFSTD